MPDRCRVSASERCFGVSVVVRRSSVIPSTPFIGVRISWLIFARNCDLARFAASAASFACRNSMVRSRTACSSESVKDWSRCACVVSRVVVVSTRSTTCSSSPLQDGEAGELPLSDVSSPEGACSETQWRVWRVSCSFLAVSRNRPDMRLIPS